MVDKISTVIGKPVKDIRLRLHIEPVRKFNNKVEPLCRQFPYNDKEYASFDFGRYVTLEYTAGEWARDKSIMITEKNLFTVRSNFRRMVRNLYATDIFVQKKSGELILPKDMEEKYTVPIYDLGMNQYLLLKPTIVTDYDNVTYEGVAIFFNKTGNCCAVSISEFEALVEALNNIDLFLYSHQVLSLYLQYVDKIDIIKPEQRVETEKTNVFEKDIAEIKFKNTRLNKEEFFGVGGES